MFKVVRGAMTALFLVVPSLAFAQSTGTQAAQTPVRVPGSSVTVTATKEPADPAALPLSITAVPNDLIKAAGITFVSDAGILSPNTYFTEFTARKLSNPRIRGIGASPANPGVVTYVDGVPQLNSNSSSFDLVDVGQIEFVRGPQSALFGRNALGGLINITSAKPSMSKWGGNVAIPFGSDGLFETRATVSGPVADGKMGAGFSMSYARRDGFTTNTLTGHELDSRESFSGKGQLLWTPNKVWETRVIVSGERARDGDYALNDLAALRQDPFRVQRDFEGSTSRDLVSTALLVNREGKQMTFSSTTGLVNWKTSDRTDLDYSALPLATRANDEQDTQFTQEFRFGSAASAGYKLSDRTRLRWQGGAFFFKQDYSQNAANTIAPYVLSPFIPFQVVQTSPKADLNDNGVGLYGQGTLAFNSKVDVSFGARLDYENKDADILTSYTPQIAAPVAVNKSASYTDVSPQAAVAFRVKSGTLVYATISRAFKAGGFNPVSLPGAEAYDEEHAMNVEGGVKLTAANGRYSARAAVFNIQWDDLQLNVPIQGAPGQFFINNVGDASSRGAEFELMGRPHDGVDLFGIFGFTRARFGENTFSQGVDVSDKKIPNTPAYTATFGAQITRALGGGNVYGRAEVVCFGAFKYDDANTQGQDAYSVTNLRAGWKGHHGPHNVSVEAWVRNAFDKKYIPLAFAFPGYTASGFLGEPGRPRTAGITVGIGF